jgi:hypothetical protein
MVEASRLWNALPMSCFQEAKHDRHGSPYQPGDRRPGLSQKTAAIASAKPAIRYGTAGKSSSRLSPSFKRL